MSRKYKFNDKNGVYFISFATVYWIDVFVRDCYFETMISALNYCRENRGIKIYGYCIMPSHVHLLFQIEEKNPSDVIRDLKTFTSKALLKQIAENPQESRKEWLLWMFRRAAKKYSYVKQYQFWQPPRWRTFPNVCLFLFYSVISTRYEACAINLMICLVFLSDWILLL